jgi:hypothetical protein
MHYPPDPGTDVGTAMVIAPGGGFRSLMMSYEGVDVARYLNKLGVHAYVLKYRLICQGEASKHGFRETGGGADHYLNRLQEWMKVNGWLSKNP